MTHIVIFGERPGPNTDPKRPLHIHTSTGAAEKLRQLMGLTKKEYYETSRYNVVNNMHTSTSHPEVRARVADLITKHRRILPQATRFVFLGGAARDAAPVPYRKIPFGSPIDDVICIPHTSGLNRYYNSEANTLFIIESLRKFLRRI